MYHNFYYKTKLCPNFEIQKATRRAEQSLITLISNTCATPHSFQRVSNYFCKTLVVLLQQSNTCGTVIAVQHLWYCYRRKCGTHLNSSPVNTNSFVHATALHFKDTSPYLKHHLEVQLTQTTLQWFPMYFCIEVQCSHVHICVYIIPTCGV